MFLKDLLNHLNDGGKILIGDIAFETREEFDAVREEVGNEWDEEEFYCIAEELKTEFPSLNFEKITFCSGILTLSR